MISVHVIMSENYRVTNGTQLFTDNVHSTLISYHRPKGIYESGN